MSPTSKPMILWGILIVVMIHLRRGDSAGISPNTKSQNCSAAIDKVLDSAFSGVPWAADMVDASGRPPVGIKRLGSLFALELDQVPPGSLQFLGNYDQCLGVETTEDFGTLYCRVHVHIAKIGLVHLPAPKHLYVDICAPDICDGDLVPFARNYLKQVSNIDATVIDGQCFQRSRPFTYKAIVTICVLTTLLVLVAMGTVYDVIVMQNILAIFKDTSTTTSTTTTTTTTTRNGSKVDDDDKSHESENVTPKPGIAGQLLLPFSLYTNLSNLLSTHHSEGSLPCINGIRSLSVMWIILGHVYFAGDSTFENAMPHRKEANRGLFQQFAILFLLAVDTFFVLSALLVTYKTMRQFRTKKPSLDYFKGYYFHRYLRLTPPYIVVAITWVALFKYVADGPFWPQGDVEPNECEHSWWRNALYINNFAQYTDVCLKWSWSVSMDMQFFIFSPLVLLPLYYYDWRGLTVPLLMLMSSILMAGGFSYYFKLMPLVEPLEGFAEYMLYYYTNPLTRAGPYIIGMMTGYLLYKTNCEIKVSKRVITIGWTMSAIIVFGVFASVYEHINGNRLSNEMSTLYNALHRNLWSMAVCWVIFACSCGYGGIVNTFLSWKVFVPLTSIAYCTYLVHPLVLAYYFLSQRRHFYLNHTNVIFAYISCLVLSFVLATVTYLVCEAPFSNLVKAIRRIRNQNKTKHHQN